MRLAVVLGVALAAFGAQYRLAHIRLPVEVGDPSKVPTRPIRLGEQLVIVAPVSQAPGSPIFAYKGNAGEAVDLHFENAKVAEETVRNYEFSEPFKSNSGPIFFITDPGLDSVSRAEPCLALVEASTGAAQSLPGEIRFSQSGTPGNESLRELNIQTDVEVMLRTATFPPESATDPDAETSDDGPGCARRLSLLAGSETLQGVSVVKLPAAARSEIKFLFWPLNKGEPMWNGSDGFFEPFKAASPVFQVRALSIRTATGNPAFEITAESPSEPLRINKLKVGSGELLVEISGKGFVTIDGETISLSFFERINQYPWSASLVMIANAALLTWLGRQVRSLFKP